MHPITVRMHHWFVPNRHTWDEWEDFITGVSSATVPQGTVSGTGVGNITDYLGIPNVNAFPYNQLPLRAYNHIYNEFYRDQDLVTEVALTDATIKKIAWEKDYYTSARPWPQKGGEVTVPIGTKAPVFGLGTVDSTPLTGPVTVRETGATSSTSFAEYWQSDSATKNFFIEEDPDNANYPGVYADLSAATGVNVNELREAFALQRYQEARARYGSRYTEYLRYCGVTPSDARLQRPEYLGGGRQTIAFSEVLQTAPEAASSSEVGELKGHGIAALRSRRYRRFFEEHGYILTLMSIRPKTIYANAVPRHWLRQTKEDYYQKELEHIGQQEITNKEVYATVAGSGDDTFGYADRYREYREQPSQISGNFRGTFDYWHQARIFSSAPALNQSFIECDPDDRIHADQTSNHKYWCMVNHSIQARRMVGRSAAGRII
jgi:hypothetical protein